MKPHDPTRPDDASEDAATGRHLAMSTLPPMPTEPPPHQPYLAPHTLPEPAGQNNGHHKDHRQNGHHPDRRHADGEHGDGRRQAPPQAKAKKKRRRGGRGRNKQHGQQQQHGEHEVKATPIKHRWVLFVVGIAAVLLVGGFLLILHLKHSHADREEREARTKAAEKGPRVSIVEAKVAPVTRKLTLPGDVRAFRQATVYARVSGYLAGLYVDRGDKVKANQVLGRVTTPETEYQLAPLVASYAAKKGIADHLRPLVPKGVVADIDLERADADAQAAKSEVDRLSALTRFNDIRAPFDGVVTQRYVDIGALMPAPTGATSSAQPLVDIADISKVRVVCYVGQRDATGIKVGDDLSIMRDNDPLHPVPAKVTQIPNDLDPRTRTMWVEADVDNKDGAFYPGVFVTMSLDVPAPEGVLVPSDAISLNKGEPVVALIDGDKAHYQIVQIADDDGRTARVIRGLKAGDKLANRVSDEIVEGGRVQPVDPKQQKEGEGDKKSGDKKDGSAQKTNAGGSGSGSGSSGGEGSSAAETSGRGKGT